MKKIVWILLIIAMMAGCNEARNPLLKNAAEIVHQRPDSSRVLISKVDTISLSEAESMEYNQQKYDEERWEQKAQERMIKMAGVITIAIVFVLTIGVWWHRKRVHELAFRLDENARQINENQVEIERLQQSGEASEQTIAVLNKQVEDSRQRISNKLLIGTRCFVRLQQKTISTTMTTPSHRYSE